MKDDFRKEIDCVYIDRDGHCLKDSEPDFIDWCVLGPCSQQVRRSEASDDED